MDESLDSKQDQLAAVQIVPNTYRKHNPTGVLQYGRQLEMLQLNLASKLAFHPVTKTFFLVPFSRVWYTTQPLLG
jgi:hypothetical protein